MALLSNIAIFATFEMLSGILWLNGDKWSGGFPNNNKQCVKDIYLKNCEVLR